jgi:type IV pilus assembly protein PilQ
MRTGEFSRTATRAGGRRGAPLLAGGLAALVTALTVAAVAGSSVMKVSADAAGARLTAISARSGSDITSVLIEASEPAAYVTTRPDPLTVLVDLRNVSAAGAVNKAESVSSGPLRAVTVEEVKTPDGTTLARVRLKLTRPVNYLVHSARNFIQVDLPHQDSAAVTLGAGAAKGGTQAPAAVRATDVPASVLRSIRAATESGATRVTLTGDGKLVPGSVEMAKDPPPRLILDFSALTPGVAAVTPVDLGPVRRIRVATHSMTPPVTRVVFDLSKTASYQIVPGASSEELVVVFDGRSKAAAAPAPATPAPVTPTPVAPTPVAPTPVAPAPAAPAPAAPPAAAPPTASVAPPTPPVKRDVVPQAPKTEASPAPPKPSHPEGKPPESVPQVPPPASPSPAPQAETQLQQTQPLQPSGPGRRQYTGQPVSFDFQQADLRTVLRAFAEISGLNIVIDPKVEGTVDVSLKDVPWDQALEIILRANKLDYVVDGTIVRIAPVTVLAEEEGQRRKLADEQALSGELKILTKTLSYAQAKDLEPLVKGNTLSNRGTTAVDARTNTLIITDLPQYLAKAEGLLNTLDQPEGQVEIEARLVQTSRSFARELGVKWGFLGRASPELGNTTALAFPNSGSISGRTGAVEGPNLTPSAVNLGVAGATSAVGLALGSVNGAFNLDIALSALESEGKIKILRTPRIVTQNNVKARITRGQEIPYTTTSAAPPTGGSGVVIAQPLPTVQFKTAALTLEVTPRITPSGTVLLQIDVDNGSPGEEQANGNIAINTQRAQTTVLVKDAQTTVIAGIFTNDERNTQNRVPGLHRIPLLGWLFKNDRVDQTEEELLIFITPKIMKVQ